MDRGSQMRFSEEELTLLKATFKDNEKLLKLLRKVFLPQYDPYAPFGQTVDSLWMGLDQLSQMVPQDRETMILTQIRLNNHIERQLMQLDALAKLKNETEEEEKARLEKDSTK